MQTSWYDGFFLKVKDIETCFSLEDSLNENLIIVFLYREKGQPQCSGALLNAEIAVLALTLNTALISISTLVTP